jgi:aspartokinase/homoserine dehydrogenase 1
MKILKFGGTSVGSPARLRGVVEIVLEAAAHDRLAVVVSAMAGVTDALGDAAERAVRSEFDVGAFVGELAVRHLNALAALRPGGCTQVRDEIRARLKALGSGLQAACEERSCPPPRRDEILATGERLTAPLLAAKLRARGHDAVVLDGADLVVTNSVFGQADVELRATAHRVVTTFAKLAPTAVPVITGFIGADATGRTTTLGRGGSDSSATLIGAALRASVVEIWTDVDGVLTAPPRLIADAATMPVLSYREAAALAAFGAKVLHAKSVAPAAAVGVPIVVRNSFNADGPRTTITAAPSGRSGEMKAIAALDERASLWRKLPPGLAPHGIGLGLLAVVGDGIGHRADLVWQVRALLTGDGHDVLHVASAADGAAIVAFVREKELHACAMRLHAGLGLGRRDTLSTPAPPTPHVLQDERRGAAGRPS